MARIDTKTGDDGTTGLFYGGRVNKSDPRPRAYGAVDEAQAALGLIRALGNLAEREEALVVDLQSDLYILMAELATMPENQGKLEQGKTAVSAAMVDRLEVEIGHYYQGFQMPTEFIIPGSGVGSGLFDFARTVVRRAEREVVALGGHAEAVRYLNRLSDLLWTLARWSEPVAVQARDHLIEKEKEREGK